MWSYTFEQNIMIFMQCNKTVYDIYAGCWQKLGHHNLHDFVCQNRIQSFYLDMETYCSEFYIEQSYDYMEGFVLFSWKYSQETTTCSPIVNLRLLSCHVQYFVSIWYFSYGVTQNQFTNAFELQWKIHLWNQSQISIIHFSLLNPMEYLVILDPNI